MSALVECGLNADWSCQAWHAGPSAEPNRTDGDVYVLDDENGPAFDDGEDSGEPGTFTVVTRRHVDGDNDVIAGVAFGLSFDVACIVAKARAAEHGLAVIARTRRPTEEESEAARESYEAAAVAMAVAK